MKITIFKFYSNPLQRLTCPLHHHVLDPPMPQSQQSAKAATSLAPRTSRPGSVLNESRPAMKQAGYRSTPKHSSYWSQPRASLSRKVSGCGWSEVPTQIDDPHMVSTLNK